MRQRHIIDGAVAKNRLVGRIQVFPHGTVIDKGFTDKRFAVTEYGHTDTISGYEPWVGIDIGHVDARATANQRRQCLKKVFAEVAALARIQRQCPQRAPHSSTIRQPTRPWSTARDTATPPSKPANAAAGPRAAPARTPASGNP